MNALKYIAVKIATGHITGQQKFESVMKACLWKSTLNILYQYSTHNGMSHYHAGSWFLSIKAHAEVLFFFFIIINLLKDNFESIHLYVILWTHRTDS